MGLKVRLTCAYLFLSDSFKDWSWRLGCRLSESERLTSPEVLEPRDNFIDWWPFPPSSSSSSSYSLVCRGGKVNWKECGKVSWTDCDVQLTSNKHRSLVLMPVELFSVAAVWKSHWWKSYISKRQIERYFFCVNHLKLGGNRTYHLA